MGLVVKVLVLLSLANSGMSWPYKNICGNEGPFLVTNEVQMMKSKYTTFPPSHPFSCRWVFNAANPQLPIHLDIRPPFLLFVPCSFVITVKDGDKVLESFCESRGFSWRSRRKFVGFSGSMSVIMTSNVNTTLVMFPIKMIYYQGDTVITTSTSAATTPTTRAFVPDRTRPWTTSKTTPTTTRKSRTTKTPPTTTTIPSTTMDIFARTTVNGNIYCGQQYLVASEGPKYIYPPSGRIRCLWFIKTEHEINIAVEPVNPFLGDGGCSGHVRVIGSGWTAQLGCGDSYVVFPNNPGYIIVVKSEDRNCCHGMRIMFYQNRTSHEVQELKQGSLVGLIGGGIVLVITVIIILAVVCYRRLHRRRRHCRAYGTNAPTVAVISKGLMDDPPPAYSDVCPSRKNSLQTKEEDTKDGKPSATASSLA